MSLIIYTFYATIGFNSINLPAIEGTVLYEGVNSPVEGAYVICFYYEYHLWGLHFGGANRYFNDVDVVKTTKDGNFKLRPYKTVNLGLDNVRKFLIYKPGYLVQNAYVLDS
jgi:hypothetical protein